MHFYLGLLMAAFLITAGLFVPFIGLLYRLRFTRREETQEVRKGATANFYKIRQLHAEKRGTPTGGGVLVAAVVVVLFGLVLSVPGKVVGIVAGYSQWWEVTVLFAAFVGFGLLGFYDDVMKIFGFENFGFFGLRMRHKFFLQWVVGLAVAAMMHWGLGIDFVYLPVIGIWRIGIGFFFLAAFLIVAMANAFDITDGLDGLSAGLLAICLLAFWTIALVALDHIMSVFIALWLGAVMAFLYFNIYPARIMLGNTGGLAFGATLAVIGLLTGKMGAMFVISGLFLAEGGSSLLQLFSKRFMEKRIFPIAPLHHWLQLLGWEEPKIVARAWLLGLVLAIFGVWLAVL